MRRCTKQGHTRVYYSTGKSDCYECKKVNAAKSRMKPENRARKNAYEAKRRSMPGYREHIAKLSRMRKYGTDKTPNGICEICKKKPAKVIDHDHTTGDVRGYLCIICNVWLAVHENAEFNINAAEYVKSKLKAKD
jgi:hypothetical protein